MKSELEIQENYKGFAWEDGCPPTGQYGGWVTLWEKDDCTMTDFTEGVVLRGLGADFDHWIALRIDLAKSEVFYRLEANFEYYQRMEDQRRMFNETGILVDFKEWEFNESRKKNKRMMRETAESFLKGNLKAVTKSAK